MHRGNTLDSHRLLYLAGQQGLDKQHNLAEEQHNLAEELFLGYFTQGKYIGDKCAYFSFDEFFFFFPVSSEYKSLTHSPKMKNTATLADLFCLL